jgi:glucan phosphoethanolaminetransferase (alkaline phosphatase superfamily)
MHALTSPIRQASNFPVKLITLFAIVSMLGLMPWEYLFPIQIVNTTIKYLTSELIGLVGLLGLFCTLAICVKDLSRFTLFIKLLAGVLSVILLILICIGLMFPTFNWEDKGVYRNGNDYIVVQEQQTFVTSNTVYPRLVRTTSPYGMIRYVEEQYQLNDDDLFLKDSTLVFKGITWRKELEKQ